MNCMTARDYPVTFRETKDQPDKGRAREPKKKLKGEKRPGRENVGLVRFELTIDGSLRHASVLQRVIIKHQNRLSYWCSPRQLPGR
jgi:hypothetical protein